MTPADPPPDRELEDPSGLWPGDEEDLAQGADHEDVVDAATDRSGLTAADLEPKPPSRLGRRLRFLSGAQVALIILALIFILPLILAVALNPLIKLLSG